MSRRFINERLITSRRFAPGTGRAAPSAAGNSPENAEAGGRRGPARRADLGEMMRAEARELRRLHRELLQQTVRLREECRHEAEAAASRLRRVEQAAARLEELPDIPEAPGNDAAALGPWRQTIEGVRVELLKVEQERLASAPGQTSPSPVDLESLGFGQISRWGIAFTWPLAVAVLLAALIIGAVLLLVFAG